jgi:metal-responsive CopG/Arc/MetJ family transcriptional regulator
MITQTLQITDVPEDLIHLLDQRASQQATDRSAYIRDLLRRDLERTSASEKKRFANRVVRKKKPLASLIRLYKKCVKSGVKAKHEGNLNAASFGSRDAAGIGGCI